MRKGRSSDSHRPAGGLPVPRGTVARRFACGIEVHTAAGTVRDSHPIPSYPPPRRDEGYPLRVTKVSIIPRLQNSGAGSFQHFVKGSEFRIFAPANRKICNSMTQKITHVAREPAPGKSTSNSKTASFEASPSRAAATATSRESRRSCAG